MTGESSIQKVQAMLRKLHDPVKADNLVTPVAKDAAGNPLGSIAAEAHKKVLSIIDRRRILSTLRARAKLSADDMDLARQLGIDVGTQHKDPTEFDI